MSLLVATRPAEKHKAVFDVRSVASWGIGAAAGAVGANPAIMIVSLLVYEAASSGAFFKRPTARVESPANRIGDVLLGVLGYKMGEWVRQERSHWLVAVREHVQGPDAAPFPSEENV